MLQVTIIIPVFGVERYIEACLSSAIEQTYGNLDILCVNDCTRDSSVDVVKQFQRRDSRVRLVHCEVNRGLGGARNLGLDRARGTYVKFLDGDDELTPDAIERLVLTLERAGADRAIAAFHVRDGEAQTSRSPFHSREAEDAALAGPLDLTAERPWLNEMWPSAWNGLWRANALARAGCRFPEQTYYEDHEFHFAAGFTEAVMAYCPEPLYVYRVNRPGQITIDTSSRLYEIFPVLERLHDLLASGYAGNLLTHVRARNALRLLWERTWVFRDTADPELERYRAQASRWLLARYRRDDLAAHKDWFIDDRDLAFLLDGRVIDATAVEPACV